MMKLSNIRATLAPQEVLSAQQAAAIRGGQTQAPPPDATNAPDSPAVTYDDKRRQRPSGGTSTH